MTSGADAVSLRLENTKSTIVPGEPAEEKKNEEESPSAAVGGWTPLVVLGGVTCCLGSAVPAGYNIGVMNNAANIMGNFCKNSIQERYDIELSFTAITQLWAAVVSIFLIGGVAGSLMASWLSDKFGRGGALGIGNFFGIVGAFLFAFVPALNSVEIFMLGRLMVGLSGGIATSVVPTYMTEIAPLNKRGAVGVLCQLGVTIGIFFGQLAGLETVLGTKDRWHIMLASFAPLCILSLILLRLLPESPKYLYIIKRKEEAAIKELHRLRNVNSSLLHKEIYGLQQEAAQRTTMDTWTVGRVLRDPSVRLPLILVCLLQAGQQLSGINAVFYYSNIIFTGADLGPTGAQYATLGTGLINITMAIISVRIMSRFPRRTLFLNSSYLSIGCLIVLCIALNVTVPGQATSWLCTIVVFAYVLAYGIGLGPIPYFIGSELFEIGPRPAAMALGSVCNWGGNFIVGMLFPPLADTVGALVFLLFIIPTIFVALFTRHYLPETRGVDTALTASRLRHGFSSY